MKILRFALLGLLASASKWLRAPIAMVGTKKWGQV